MFGFGTKSGTSQEKSDTLREKRGRRTKGDREQHVNGPY